MEKLNGFLDNRELAILIWLCLFFVWGISSKDIRKSFLGCLKMLTHKAIIVTSLLFFMYIGTIIYLLYGIDFWEISYLFETIIWVVVAFIQIVNINETKQDDYFKKVIMDNVKFLVFLEFIMNLYVFNFWLEFILVPILAIIGGILGFSSTSPKHKQVETFLTKIVAIIGFGFIIFTLYCIIVDFQKFASIYNLKKLLFPIVFTVSFLPFIYLLALYVIYELIFIRINHLIKNSSLARYIKWKTIFAFNLNLHALNKWLRKIVLLRLNSKEDVTRAIFELKTNDA